MALLMALADVRLAAALGELLAAGFPVPPGLCIITDAFRQALPWSPPHRGGGAALRGAAAARRLIFENSPARTQPLAGLQRLSG